MSGGDGSPGWRIRTACVAVGLVFCASSLTPALSQEQPRPRQSRGLFDLLFGGPVRRAEPPEPVPQQRRRTRRAAPRASTGAAPAPPPVPEVEKLDNARIVVVVGDFMAGGLAEGLETAYAESPGVRVVNRTNGSSGFVRDDFYNWNAEIGPILEEEEPAIVVVMVGSNDRQQIVRDGKRENPRTEPWLEEYVKRVTAFATTVTERDIPLVWTGVPPFKSSSMSSDMLAFNDIYKRVVESVDGEFVDIWDGFVDENGSFTFTGPDVNGQPVRLRSGDGINLTRAAKRKVAFYAEKPLNKLLGDAVSPDIGTLDIENLPDLTPAPVEPKDLDRTSPISLAEPDAADGAELLGGRAVVPVSPPPEGTSRGESATAGTPGSPPEGRADNFSLRPTPAAPADDETTTAVKP